MTDILVLNERFGFSRIVNLSNVKMITNQTNRESCTIHFTDGNEMKTSVDYKDVESAVVELSNKCRSVFAR